LFIVINIDLFWYLSNIKIKIMSAAEERRKTGKWELGPGLEEEGRQVNALYQYLVSEGEINEIDDDIQENLDRLRNRKDELENQYEETSSPELISQIEQIDEELSQYDEYYIDVYDIQPEGDYEYFMKSYWIEKLGQTYAVGDDYDIDEATKKHLENFLDSEGYDSLPDWILESGISERDVVDYASELYNEWIYSDPENYLDDDARGLSNEQKKVYQAYQKKSQLLAERLETFKKVMEKETRDTKEGFEDLIETLETELQKMTEHMEEIESDPQGDYLEEKIEEEIERRVEEVRDAPLDFLKEIDLNISNFIDQGGVIDEIIRNDGYTAISPYDGKVGEENVEGTTYYIVRVD
jgi:hypothetical protein